MMIEIEKLTKLYYSIGEVSEMFNVSKSLIRYWETEFKFLTPRKNKKGDRRFTKENIQQLQIIFNLVKERGFTLEGAKQEIKNNRKNLMEHQKVIEKLRNVRQKLKSLRSEMTEEE
ncbi:MAG: MerR family transcriptional regulator [Saprospiraceae bacterium]|nr:MerR family transcriptional regulator [Saprospiraceae bacterium]